MENHQMSNQPVLMSSDCFNMGLHVEYFTYWNTCHITSVMARPPVHKFYSNFQIFCAPSEIFMLAEFIQWLKKGNCHRQDAKYKTETILLVVMIAGRLCF